MYICTHTYYVCVCVCVCVSLSLSLCICVCLRMNTSILYFLSGELVGTLFNLPPPSILHTLMRGRYSIGIVVSRIVDSEFQSCPSTPV